MEERGGSNTKQNEPSWEIEAENKPTHTNRKACKDGVFGVGGGSEHLSHIQCKPTPQCTVKANFLRHP